jgi:hypothetical protein
MHSNPRLSPRMIVAFTVISLLTTVGIFGQNNRKDRFDPDGSFWLHGEPPNEFSDFGSINLNAKRLRRLPSPGLQLNNGKTFRFKLLSVKRESFTFTTVTISGVSYSFSGRFLKGGIFAAGDLDDETPVLEGQLTKFTAGQKIAETKLTFVYFGGT